MTGPSAVTVSLMDGAWAGVKRLPLGPSLSDAWWRFGGLMEVKVSSNRAKFPAVITEKIKGIAIWYEGTSRAAPPRHKAGEGRDAFSIWREIGAFVLGSQLSPNRQDSPRGHCVHKVLPTAHSPGKMKTSFWCPSQHTCCCDTGGHSTTPMQKYLWNSQFKCPHSFYRLETRVLTISIFLLPLRSLCG